MSKKIYKTIAIPAERVNIDVLSRFLDGWGAVIKSALGCTRTDFYISESDGIAAVFFPWWKGGISDESKATVYKLFIDRLCNWSREQFCTIVSTPSFGDKLYTFKWLLYTLGFGGNSWYNERRILCERLSKRGQDKT